MVASQLCTPQEFPIQPGCACPILPGVYRQPTAVPHSSKRILLSQKAKSSCKAQQQSQALGAAEKVGKQPCYCQEVNEDLKMVEESLQTDCESKSVEILSDKNSLKTDDIWANKFGFITCVYFIV